MPRKRESHYQSVPFHAVRAISFLSNAIVSGVLIYFLLKLKSDGFKLPWTLLIVLGVSLATLIYLLVSYCVHLCGVVSPLFSIIINIPLFIAWLVAFSLLTDNIYGLLGHSCSTANWGNARGVSVCSIYKTFYAFALFCVLSEFAHIVLDYRARRRQKRRGAYDRMAEESKENLKLDTFDATTRHTVVPDVPYGAGIGMDAPIYRGADNFYDDPGNKHRRERSSSRTGRPPHLAAGRPGLYSREGSSHQSTRSDAPMLSNYGSRWANEQTSYQSGRYDSPHRY